MWITVCTFHNDILYIFSFCHDKFYNDGTKMYTRSCSTFHDKIYIFFFSLLPWQMNDGHTCMIVSMFNKIKSVINCMYNRRSKNVIREKEEEKEEVEKKRKLGSCRTTRSLREPFVAPIAIFEMVSFSWWKRAWTTECSDSPVSRSNVSLSLPGTPR